MRPARIFCPSSSGSERMAIGKVLSLAIALGLFLITAFQAPLAFGQQSPPLLPKFPLPVQPTLPTLACPQPNLAAPKNALVIFVEENTAQSFSVSWKGMSTALQRMGTMNLLPQTVHAAVDTVLGNIQRVIPSQINFIPDIEDQLRRHVAQMTKEMVRRGRNMFGLPGTGCIGGILDTLGRVDLRIGEDIYHVFTDTYGEAGLANCLKESALPYYDYVTVLTDQTASFQNLSDVLLRLHRCGFTIDVLMDAHGCGTNITMNNRKCDTPGLYFYNPSNPSTSDPKNAQQLEQIKAANGGQPLRLNAVYMVSCWGAEFNQAWINIGAKASNGSRELDYYVLLSPFLFLDGFTRGDMTLKAAADSAYNVEKTLLNGLSYPVEVDLRPKLNELFPIRYAATIPCGVKIGDSWFGLSTKIDYRGDKDCCVGAIGPQNFDFEKNCPIGYTKVIQHGDDRCKQDLLGPLRDQAHWRFDLGVSYTALIDRALAIPYGANPALPVNNRASSQRIQLGDIDVREANVCRKKDEYYCFGAIGAHCGGIPIPGTPQGEYWGCSGNNCVINAGSWEHDECCFRNDRVGTMCGVISGPACNAEWSKAVHRTLHRLSWKRRVDSCKSSERGPAPGRVIHAEYCAPAGTIVAREDAARCCGGRARAFNFQDAGDQGLARAQRVIFDPSYVAAVCTQP